MANTNRAPFPNGLKKLPLVNPFLDADGNPINYVKTADMQAALDAELADIDGGAPDTSYTDTIDGGTP